VKTESPAEAELVVDPELRGHGHGTALIESLLEISPDELLVWAHGDHPAARALAARFGFDAVRRLLQLRAEVRPVATDPWDAPGSAATGSDIAGSDIAGSDTPGADAALRISTFRPGTDEDEWVALNARAFASHPEQGSVTRTDLEDLEREPWFDAQDFLLLKSNNRIIGYCWLKIEPANPATGSENSPGEFYVVGIDPDRQGSGLGRVLVAAGLARLARRGIRTASLFVEADNGAALRLYRSFGFADHSIDIQYALRRFTSR
jgi:mycothiol synthase